MMSQKVETDQKARNTKKSEKTLKRFLTPKKKELLETTKARSRKD